MNKHNTIKSTIREETFFNEGQDSMMLEVVVDTEDAHTRILLTRSYGNDKEESFSINKLDIKDIEILEVLCKSFLDKTGMRTRKRNPIVET